MRMRAYLWALLLVAVILEGPSTRNQFQVIRAEIRFSLLLGAFTTHVLRKEGTSFRHSPVQSVQQHSINEQGLSPEHA
jgi:hypothetical protein